MFSCTVILQSTGGSILDNSCSLGQFEENTLRNDGKLFEVDGAGEVALARGVCDDEVGNDVLDRTVLESGGGGGVAEGVAEGRPLQSDSGGGVAEGVAEGLRLTDELCNGDACFRFLVNTSNKRRRVLAVHCDFGLEVNGEGFRL